MILRALARALEREKPQWMRSLGLSLDPVRTLTCPRGCRVIGVGGATLGGSGRTPLAIAVARALHEHEPVAFVAHGHGRLAREARRVSRDDDATSIGDETAIAARALDLPVFVGPRAEALALAAKVASVVVVDRLLQTRPEPLACSLLAVQAEAPWGSFARLPFGDLTTTPARLVAAADEVVAVGGALAPSTFSLERGVEGVRVGALSTMARPERMRRTLGELGLSPRVFIERVDHAPFTRSELAALARHRVDAWVVDAKTAVLLPRGAGLETILLSHTVTLSFELHRRIRARANLAKPGARC